MRLTLPDPKIDIGKDGFETSADGTKKCHLNRAETGRHLSRLVDSIEDPMVIALDGSWGSGKSHFLKLWTGAHVNENGGKAKTIYFDAFEHDFLDDPLITLISKLSEKPETPGKFKKLKATGMKLLKPAARTTLAAATYGGTELVGALGDAILNKAANELETLSEAFWEKEASRTAAMQEFKTALRELTEPDDDGKPTQKIVIIIDELDRCRPDYALNMLEIMKHFFAVDGIHFVLGVNLAALQSSVQARYGGGINAAEYLQKFISVTLTIGNSAKRINQSALYQYYLMVGRELSLLEHRYYQTFKTYLNESTPVQNYSLREIERYASHVALLQQLDISWGGQSTDYIVAGLLIIKVKEPSLYHTLRKGQLPVSEVFAFFNMERPDYPATHAPTVWSEITSIWQYYLEASTGLRGRKLNELIHEDFEAPREKLLSTLITDYLDIFELPT
ncbi:KAP family P-loop NTPase fold protein [Cochlodiniinecator piscidefendens]|uniref:KAP family P-loop NTPase fold protein n=1 Tax=Cochlodiniinecator piscidefendens TaxID=2715756 RepID=UPI0022B13C81|nr:P-loop NTPase fold protein [Cochlodiniinecator piscidefendens]